MSSLKQAAIQFGLTYNLPDLFIIFYSFFSIIAATLNIFDCPIIHLTGETHMLSCYEAGACVRKYHTAFTNHM